MEFFKTNTRIQFMGQRKWAAVFSALIIIVSIVTLSIKGLALGLDFTGGTQIEMHFQQPVVTETVRDKLSSANFPEAVVQPYNSYDLSIRVGPHKELGSQEQLRKKILDALPSATITSAEYMGPQVSQALVTNGILAIVLVLLGTMAYIAMRFEIRFAVSAAIALIHDPVLVLGIFSLFHLEFNMIVMTGLLTVIGYSLNDTIVVYDRVRENFRKMRKGSPLEIMDLSINQTLSRTIMTSGLTLTVVIALYLFGGEMVHGFALALIIGIIIGTYSSIYVAGSLAVALGLNRTHLATTVRKLENDLP